jgi:N-acetyl-gamma-glutamyl-phosphate reductase
MLKAGIAGGSGYSGAELVGLLLNHPEMKLTWLSSGRYEGEKVEALYPHLRGLTDLSFSPVASLTREDLDVLFLAMPHGNAMELAPVLDPDTLVIDLSGDFRIGDPEVFQKYYGFPMKTPALQKDFVYGLSEINREKIRGARRIANPGCFATATLLGMYPLYREHLIEGPVYVDAKTGSSGSGRNPNPGTHHPRRCSSFFGYKSFSHQHMPEMRQLLSNPGNPLVFQAHSAPMVRGIFSTHFTRLKKGVSAVEIKDLYLDFYRESPFIRWVDGSPDVSSVLHSNFADIGMAENEGFLVIWAALDNLQKGAAGQAVQNLNICLGLPETTALERAPSFP